MDRRKLFKIASSLPALLLPVWARPASSDPSPLFVDLRNDANFSFTLSGNKILVPLNASKAHQSGVIFLRQDSVGSRTLTFSDEWKFRDGAAPLLTSRGDSCDVIHYFVADLPKTIYAWIMPDLK